MKKLLFAVISCSLFTFAVRSDDESCKPGKDCDCCYRSEVAAAEQDAPRPEVIEAYKRMSAAFEEIFNTEDAAFMEVYKRLTEKLQAWVAAHPEDFDLVVEEIGMVLEDGTTKVLPVQFPSIVLKKA